MKTFVYQRADDLPGALVAGRSPGAAYLAGGTNLVDLMKLGVAQPSRLIDISGLPLAEVEELTDGALRIGALVRNADLAAHPAIRGRYPLLAQALLSGASGQIRNVATVGGNLLQRTRCPYFQDVSKPCNKRLPGSGCPAREGEHRNLAILGHSPACVATHPSDMAVALAALDARVELEGEHGRRTIPLRELYRLPAERPEHDTVLAPGELITAVELDPASPGMRSSYRKVRERASFAFALVAVAVAVEVADGAVQDCRIAFGGVAHIPWRATRAEAAVRGQTATEEVFLRAAEAELAAAEPLQDNEYKRPLARNVLVRTLTELCI